MRYMKVRVYYLVPILLALFLVAHSAQAFSLFTPKKSLTSGLVGWYTFDGKDITNGRINDVSGNGNNGVVSNISTSTFYTSGKIGQAVNFDGSDDYIKPGVFSGGQSVLTVSFWIKSRVSTNPGTPVSKGRFAAATTGSWDFQRSGAGLWSMNVANASAAAVTANGPSGHNNTNWQFVTGVYDGSTITLYVNAVAGTPVAQTGAVQTAASYPVCIGAVNGDSSGQCDQSRFNGIIDDIRIYNRALTASEVLQLYNQGGGNKQNTAPNLAGSTGLIAWWTFDGKDVVNGVFRNISTTSTFYGRPSGISTSTFYVPGKIGQGVRFDGNDDVVVAGDMTNADNVSSLSVSVWVKPAVADTSAMTFFSKTRTGFDTWFVARNGFEQYWVEMCNASTCADAISDSSFADTNWHHLVGVYNGTDVRLYVDGVSADATPPSLTGTLKDRSDSICFGGAWNGSSCSQSYTGGGLLDDARIYSKALSASEVLQLYNEGAGTKQGVVSKKGLNTGLVGWWTFDGKDVVSGRVNDISGNGNNGTLSGISTSTFYTVGKIGQGFKFDAVDDYVDVGDLSGVEGKTALSVSLWVKSTETENVSVADTIIAKSGSGADTFELYWEQNESVSFCVVGSSGTSCGGADTAIASYANGIPIGSGRNWYHIAGVYDSVAGNVKVYVNGVLGGTTGSLSSLTQNSTHTIKIGTTWSGTIDDVRIYNRALSASEVLQLYNQGR